jgi:very-short-patch-repair endonuclease/RecA/RadA recombinase
MGKQISEKEFKSLLSYYSNCLEKEELLSLTFNFKSDGRKFYSNLFENEEFFHSKKEQILLQKTEDVNKFFQNYKLVQNHKSLFYGYPIIIDSNGSLSPIFFTELLIEEKKDHFVFTKVSVEPEFNHYVLARRGFGLEEINKIRIDLDEEDDFQTQLESILELLNLSSESISSSLSKDKLKIQNKIQLVNKAILYSGERTGIIYGLLTELNKLSNISYDKILSSSLGHFFSSTPNILDNTQHKRMLEIFQLNNSQEKSIKNAFTKPITVITGPPGTGKSQVVLNLIANAVYNDKTVLFASKNNKAVDVVIDKLNSILSEKIIVRMGHRFHRRNAKSIIDDLFLNKNTIKISEDRNDFIQLLQEISNEITSIKNQLQNMVELNDEIDVFHKNIDNIIKKLPSQLYLSCRNDNYDHVNKFQLEKEINIIFGKNLSVITKILRILFPTRYRRKQHELFQRYYNKLSKSFKKYLEMNISLDTEHIKLVLRWILLFKQIDLFKGGIEEAANKLAKYPSIYELYQREKDLHEKRIKMSKQIFENYWLTKIKSTQIDDQNHVSRYFDAAEKLETWIQDRSLWEQLMSDQTNSLDNILSFLPVWVVTNLSAKNSLPLKGRLFDLLIIDEASQCDIASALPLMYRAKNVVVIGDPKQLKHISLLKQSQDEKLAAEQKIESLFLDYSYSKNSLYDLSERTIRGKNELPILLNEHYRSHPDIINFSNKFFYEEKLNILTDESKLLPDDQIEKRIMWNNVKGRTVHSKSPYNVEEANKTIEQVVEIIEKINKSNLKNVSLGIVTLFRAQMELIIDKIKKLDQIKDMDITVGTAHRFQGDEKDIIIFSPAISDKVKQTTLNWIHSTNQLLNVAITRARSGLIIVGDREKCLEAKGLLGNLVEYADTKKDDNISFDSNIEKILFDELAKNNIKVIPQYQVNVQNKVHYRLDFAMFINENKYDIEVDGDKAHAKKDDYDILRDIHLRMDGWRVRRFQASDIQNNLDGVIEQINRIV